MAPDLLECIVLSIWSSDVAELEQLMVEETSSFGLDESHVFISFCFDRFQLLNVADRNHRVIIQNSNYDFDAGSKPESECECECESESEYESDNSGCESDSNFDSNYKAESADYCVKRFFVVASLPTLACAIYCQRALPTSLDAFKWPPTMDLRRFSLPPPTAAWM
jgi:hypothetical protein